jgi:hypothetical protein
VYPVMRGRPTGKYANRFLFGGGLKQLAFVLGEIEPVRQAQGLNKAVSGICLVTVVPSLDDAVNSGFELGVGAFGVGP